MGNRKFYVDSKNRKTAQLQTTKQLVPITTPLEKILKTTNEITIFFQTDQKKLENFWKQIDNTQNLIISKSR